MKLLYLLLLAISATVFSEEKENVERQKVCITQTEYVHMALFTKDELCSFGKKGCKGVEVKNRIHVYCESILVSECYPKKLWVTENQKYGLDDKIRILMHNSSTSIKDGKSYTESCATYDKK